jgi:tetratricopeptide (TPR) repeat protein
MGPATGRTAPEVPPVEDDLDLPSGPPRVERWMLFGLIVAVPLALGGVHPEVRVAALALALSALWIRAWRLGRDGRRIRPGAWGWALIVAAGVALLQWIPLPVALVELLAPSRHAAAVLAAEAVGSALPTTLSLGLDAPIVAYGLVGLLLHGAIYALAASRAGDRVPLARLIIAVEVAAATVVAVGLLHAALDWQQLLGFYTPASGAVNPHFPATFVNPNHMAALCLVAAVAAFGAAIASKTRAPWHIGMATVAAFGVVASMSRANALLLVAGLVLVGGRWAFARQASETRVRARRLLAGTLALVFIAVIFVGPERWAGELRGVVDGEGVLDGVARACWAVGVEVVGGHMWVGAGSGAMALATPTVMPSWESGLVTHAHAGPLEVLGELGGVAGGAVLLLVLVGWARTAGAALKDPLRTGAWVALTLLALQNLVDFSMWIPGVGVTAAALAGALGGRVERAPPGGSRTRGMVALGVFTVLAGAAGVAAWQGRAAGPTGSQPDWRELAVARSSNVRVVAEASAAAEASGDAVAARRLAALARTLAPTMPEAIARAFKFAVVDGQDDEAARLVELLMGDWHVGRELAYDLVLEARAREGLLERFFGQDAERVLRGAQKLSATGERDAALALVRWGVGRFPEDAALAGAFAARLPRDEAGQKELERLGTLCLVRAGEAGDDAARRQAWETVGYLVEGELAARRGRTLEAWRLLMAAAEAAEARGQTDTALRALFRAADAATAREDIERLGLVVEGLGRLEPSEPHARGRSHAIRGRWHELRGELRPAIREVQLALQAQPEARQYHTTLARLFEKAGDHEAARRARMRADAAP